MKVLEATMAEAMFEMVPTTLSDEQLAEMRDEHATKQIQRKELKEEKRKAVSDFNARISALESQMQDLATKITNRTIEVQVEYIEENVDAEYQVRLVAKGSGKELRVRDMSVEERQAADKRKLQLVLPLGEVKDIKSAPEASAAADAPKVGAIHEPTDGKCCASAEDHHWVMKRAPQTEDEEGPTPYMLGFESWFECSSPGCTAWAEPLPAKEEQTVLFVPGAETTELNGQTLVKVERVPSVPNDVPTQEDLDASHEADAQEAAAGADDDDEESEDVDEDDAEDDEDTDTPPADELF